MVTGDCKCILKTLETEELSYSDCRVFKLSTSILKTFIAGKLLGKGKM